MPGTPVAGDTYICTEPDSDTNLGAREWKYTGSDWVCVEGEVNITARSTDADSDDWFYMVHGTQNNASPRIQKVTMSFHRIGSTVTWGTSWQPIASGDGTVRTSYGFPANQRGVYVQEDGFFPTSGTNTPVFAYTNQRAANASDGVCGAYLMYTGCLAIWGGNVLPDQPWNSVGGTHVTTDPWPTSDTLTIKRTAPTRVVENLKNKLQEIEDDPEHEHHDRLNELKAELESIQEEK